MVEMPETPIDQIPTVHLPMNAPGWPDKDMITAAMGIICNVDMGNWACQSEHWQRAAKAWMEAYHRYLANQPKEPPKWEPLT